jgi:K+-dependent Na+/Ca+ exchanger-like protein
MTALFNIFVLIVCFYSTFKVVEHLFIHSLDSIADHLKLPPTITGATLMAFGTSAPEFFTSLITLFLPGREQEMGIATIIGATMLETFVVIGIASLIKSFQLNWKIILKDSFFFIVALFQLMLFARDGTIDTLESFILVSTYIFFLITQYFWSKFMVEKDREDYLDLYENELIRLAKERKNKKLHGYISIILSPIKVVFDVLISLIPNVKEKPRWTLPIFILSLFLIGVCAFFIVVSAENLGEIFKVSSSVIGLTIIAMGGAIPNIISSALVTKQGRGDMAASNAIGSNIFNILAGIGIPMFIYNIIHGPIENIAGTDVQTSIKVLLASLVPITILLIIQKFRATKTTGIILITIYILYIVSAYMV